MKALRYGALTIVFVAFCGLSQAQSAQKENSRSAREKLIGAWHLAHIEAPGPDGKPMDIPQPQGMLIYTLDGHMSVQLMYPKSANALSNEYVQDGYEASFGSYDVDEATHTLIQITCRDRLREASSSARTFLGLFNSTKLGT